MKNKLFLSLIVLSSICIYSCKDFIEVDLSKKYISIIAPANNSTSSLLTQTFKWEDLKGAETYNLQIVNSKTQQFIVDSTVHSSHFIYTLRPGTYEWKIRGENNSSHTDYVSYSLTIDSTADLAYQQINLLSPINNEYVGGLTQTFTWAALSSATNYVFQVFTSSNASVPGSLQSVTVNAATYTFATAGTYKWRVFAQNASSTSPYKEYTINIDTIHPATPIIISPKNDTTTITANPVQLKWNSATNATAYHFQVSSDSTFSESAMDTTATITNTSYNYYSATKSKKYYWRVQSIRYGINEGAYSKWWEFRRN